MRCGWAAATSELAAGPDVISIEPDRELGATYFPPYMAMEAVGYRFAAMAVPERPDVTGKGFGIAIIDSGVTKDAWLKSQASGCTTSRVVYSQNFVATEFTTDDLLGHGTHFAGSCPSPDARVLCLGTVRGGGQYVAGHQAWSAV